MTTTTTIPLGPKYAALGRELVVGHYVEVAIGSGVNLRWEWHPITSVQKLPAAGAFKASSRPGYRFWVGGQPSYRFLPARERVFIRRPAPPTPAYHETGTAWDWDWFETQSEALAFVAYQESRGYRCEPPQDTRLRWGSDAAGRTAQVAQLPAKVLHADAPWMVHWRGYSPEVAR